MYKSDGATPPLPAARIADAGTRELCGRLRLLARVRWGMAIAAFAYAGALALLEGWLDHGGNLGWLAMACLLPVGIAMTNVAVLRLCRRSPRAAVAIGLAGDLVATTLALQATGGIHSWVWTLYPLVTLESAYLTERRTVTRGVAVAGIACYAAAALVSARWGWPGFRLERALDDMGARLPIKISWVALIDLAVASSGIAALGLLDGAHQRLRDAYRLLERQYQALGQLDRLKSSFLSTVSHELRTPTAAVLGYLELAADDPALAPATRDYVAAATQQLERLAARVDQILDYTALTAATAPRERVPVEVAELIEELAARVEDDFAAADVGLGVAPVPEHLVLEGDRHVLVEALRQLLLNARTAAGPGGRAGVEVHEAAAALEIEVWDTGPGIPASVCEALGKPFTQAGVGLTEHTPGLGLGLAYASLAASLHGGTLAVGSRPGTGASVRLHLPAGRR